VKAPSPNYWFIQPSEQDEPYWAVDLDHNGSLETARMKNPKRGGYLWAIDNDCDGFVDAVGHQPQGRQEIETYSQPQRRIALTEIAPEIDFALKGKVIPHSNLKVCSKYLSTGK